MTDPVTVVADIGGTNTRVALCDGAELRPDSIRRFRNAEHAGLSPILESFLATRPTPRAICVDMAGPVSGGVGTLTNLDWRVDAGKLAARFGATRVEVLNDLQAQGHALAHLRNEDLLPVLPGRDVDAEVRLVVNVGTGLNAVPVYTRKAGTLVPPAEAGHLSLQAQNAEEMRLLDWMTEVHGAAGPPGMEDVLSGRGLERLYAFICAEEGTGQPLPAAEIMSAFLAGEARALRCTRLFTRYFGRYAGDLALATLPFGGIYLVGGVLGHLGPHLRHLGFAEAFADKGRFNAFMTQFPVRLVTDDYAALRGCAGYLAELSGD